MRGRKQRGGQQETLTLDLLDVNEGPVIDGVAPLELQTDAGTIVGRWHPSDGGDAAIIWVGGAGGGLDGPAGGLYPRLAAELVPEGVASLRLHYRQPNALVPCVLDTLLGTTYLKTLGRGRIALVGHSFGGAVVITAGAASDAVVGVAALSSQTYGTDAVSQLAPRSLLLLHGSADQILPDRCSRDLYAQANEPKHMLLYPGCRHGLDECRAEVDRDLLAWLRKLLSGPTA